MSYVRECIIKTVEQYYGKSDLEVDTGAEDALSDFINCPEQLLLQCFLRKDETMYFHTKISREKLKSLIFYKSSARDLAGEDSLKHINIVTLNTSAAESLYQVLRQIYSPLLSSGDDLFSNKLQQNLSELESNLKILTYGKGDENVNVILSVEDEVDYWKTLGQKRESSKKEREAASSFCELFEDICEEIRSMQSSSIRDAREAVENVGGLLDDVWRFTVLPYSQDRMKHIFDIIGHVICSTIQKSLSAVDLWKVHGGSKDNELLYLLSEGLKVMQTWTSACKSLTETYWPNYALHTWIGKPNKSPYCFNFESRLQEIHDIRSTHNQLNKLLSISERTELKTNQLFEAFENMNVWICNGPNKAWETAVSGFSANLRPVESKIAEKLKPRLHNTSTKQMLHEFMRYKTLLERPQVKRALTDELEIFVSSLISLLKSIQSQLSSDEVDLKMCQPPEMSPIVQQVQWAKQMEAKVKDIHMCAEKYVFEFEGSSELLQLATQVLKELKAMYTQLHEEWSRDLQAQVKNGSLQLQLDKPVVEFSSSSRMMVVNFNPRLVWAELEARSMAALGLAPPPAAAAIDTLTAALKYARALQQVASFHNTLGERMIPSTRPMMLQAALDLSSLVQDQKAVYWDDEEQLVNYTDKLKRIVMKLETQNTYLTSQHMAIRDIVEKLMDTELLAKQSEWKKKIKDMRDIIEMVESNGYKNTELWRSHWDWQLYKALECQYIKTLLSLHKHFPHVKVDLVLRGRMVRVQPALEEIRVQHYHQLRRLVALPSQFVGVQAPQADAKSIFTTIVEKHGWLGNKAVQQLEAALSSLERTCEAWTRRAALACVPDLEALCAEHLHEPQDWELNFKACKAYGQAVAKMTFEDEKIDWISVGTATLRREFEAQTRSLWTCLLSSLQTNCRNAAGEVEAFVANAMVMVEDKGLPKNAKELAEISAKQQAFQGKMPEMEKIVEALKIKGHMLRTWGGDPCVDGTIKEWQKIRELMISHQQMFEHQAEIVKSSLSGEWDNLNTAVEAWYTRWSQARSRLEETLGAQYADMLDRCRSVLDARAQWDKYAIEREDLLKECEKFNMTPQMTDTWKEAGKLITDYVNLWTVLNEYNEEYESIAEQEWIVFQKKLHLLDEFTSKWSANLEPYTIVTLFIQQELNKYTDLTTLLKYLRGSDFTERHWREVFSLLGIEYKKPDTLQVKDFLNAALNIKRQIKTLQKISTSASSEAAVRSALNELEVWFAGARFTIIYYNDKGKRPTPIVKDFKDILAKVEEQQWVVSSVSGGGDATAAWESRLRAARALVRAAHHAQRRWLYLEPILSNDDGELGTKFRKVDQGFRQVTRMLESDPRLSALLQSSRLQPMLDSISEQLLACQSALNQYIDEKRSIFPRLYFLSDDDLLELLGQARAGSEGREAVMQTHLKKLFPGTTSVRLGPGGLSITALCSNYGETFQLDHPVDIDCPVEIWLKNLETEMRSSLKNMTLKCVVTNSLQEQDPFSLPTQILCLAQNIRFTEQVERAIASKEIHNLRANIEKENLYYASADVENESERLKRQALILQCAYYMAVIRTLIDNNVASTNDWLWQKQLRFYLLSSKEVVAKMGLAQISYSYEYLGVNTGQFVRTELADECFLILTQALHLSLVGNPFGPAGTGKTESVKALGGLVGRLVLIFNCDEAMDAECMGRLLTGLALSGAWGCFDEFNRLTADTLAAVSHQLASLLGAMRSSGISAVLNGKQVKVSEWCGVAATMNPIGRGYGGRRTLPAALERVLRPIAMTQPRGDQLAKHLLAALCISDAESLAEDLHTVFVMASTLLSGQRHYDWGLRALKATVGSCGAALSDTGPAGAKVALRRALRLNSVSKLTSYDADRFENILSMVFGEVPDQESAADPMNLALKTSIEALGLILNKLQVQKCKELYEQLQQRMGVVIVGPPGCGKTTIRRLLKTALSQLGKTIVEYTICPKAMSRSWLLGHIDHDTRQWTDGVISATALEICNQPPDVWSWVVCDGDIDPEWIEALNSVLDDNRLLTLPSGWRIQFGSNVNFIFETHSLEHASPATISRMGIILLSDDSTCAQEVLDNWLRKTEFENEMAKMALSLLQKVIKKCMQWLAVHRSDFVLKLHSISMVKQILTQFEYVAQNMGVTVIHSTSEELVYLALQRSVMGLLKDNAVYNFQEEMAELLGPPLPLAVCVGEWVSDSLYMSPRLAACEPVIRACAAADDSHLLIVGPDACAKNLIAEYILRESNSSVIAIDCTPILEPADIIAELKRNNAVRSGVHSSRSSNASITVLARALHRARVDVWGSSPVHSFLLQLIQENGFWVRGSEEEGGMQWCGVQRVRLLATASAVGAVAPRLTAALGVVHLQESDDDELLELVTHYMRQSTDKNIQSKTISELSARLISLFKAVTETFTTRPHFKWNASHLRRCCENVKWYAPSKVADLTMALIAESNMIFKHRLVTEDEKAQFTELTGTHIKGSDNEALYFATKLKAGGVYMEAVDQRDWYQTTQKLINQCLTEHEYNVFGEAGVEVCSELAVLCPAIARASNGGVVACVGSAGVGRRAAARVVAAALPAALFLANHTHHFHTQFNNALTSSGEGTPTLMVIGEGAATDAVLASVEAHCLQSSPAQQQTQQAFYNIKHNLGIVICLDKDQDNLSDLMEKYPMLYNESHLVWLEDWSSETLQEMPKLILQRLIKEEVTESDKEHNEAVPVEGFVSIHNSVETQCLRAPCRYVGFVKTYYRLVSRKRSALVQRQSMLSSGVEALRRARSEVATLQAAAAEQETALSDKQAKANQALDQIGATVRATTDKKEEMHALKKSMEIENEKLQVRKKEIEAELASVEPVIAAARAAVGDIRSESLSEVRSLRAPPDVVRDVLEGVLRLMGIADTSWHSMKSFLSKRGVKEDIKCLDASQISPEAVQSVQKLLEKRGASFEQATAKRASAACAPLAAWVRANLAYAGALARVRPLQTQQRDLHKNLKDAEAQLEALSSGLATVDERVAALKEQLGQHTRDAASIELSLSNATRTIGAARALLDQLAHEYATWEADLENISKEVSEIYVRSLLAAAYVVYLPDATEPQAKEIINKWSGLIGFEDSSFSVINFLSSTEKQLKWDAGGLPLDQSAIKNAILIDQVLVSPKCGFTPLIIDPDGDAIAWLKNTLADSQCDFISQHSDKLHTAVQYAVRLSRVLVVTEVDGIHDTWSPLLSGLPVSPAGGAAPLGARLLLYTRDATLPARLPPYYAARLSLLHFTARLDGLTDQLVHYALQQQNPEVNEKSKEMKLKKATLQKQQYELQENLLRDLSTNSDILHDANLLASLNKTRASSTVICEALEAARAVEGATRAACEAYGPSATRAALLALAVKSLAAQRPLVALPVDTILDVFVDAIRKGGGTKNLNNEEVVKYLTKRIIERVLLGLHKQDKYIVVLHLLKQVYDDLVPNKFWQIFVGPNDIIDDQANVNQMKMLYSWVPEQSLKKLAHLKTTSEDLFSRLSVRNEAMWAEFLASGDLNAISALKLSAFETVVAVAVLRPDSLYRAIVAFVDQVLGSGLVSAGAAVERAARWGACSARGARPVLLLGAHGTDVLAAHAHGLTQVGIEEGPTAWHAAMEATRGGGWLALVVGASPFTHELQAFLADFKQRPPEDFNDDFRLWIVSEDRDIPPLISNACVSVILEAPEGVKHNVTSTLLAWGGYEAPARVVRLHACLALLHALLQERRAYIPQGWSRWYAWEWGEVSACARVLRGGAAPAAARALAAALYGARVGAAPDRALLGALLRACLGDAALGPAWCPRGTALQLPFGTQLQAYTSAFQMLPDIDSPDLLGLPANSRVAWEKNAIHDIISGLKELNATVNVSRKSDGKAPLKTLLGLWKKLMSGSPLIKADYNVEKCARGWWVCACAAEARDAARAARALHAHLAHLAHSRAPHMHKVPDEWQLLWAGPDTPDAYIREFCHRAAAALRRLDACAGADDYMPDEVDLRSFLRVERVPWALRARTAARLACPAASLALSAAWGEAPAREGELRVRGLRLCGAAWAGALAPTAPRAPPHCVAPPLRVVYVPQSKETPHSADNTVEVPVYNNESREEVLLRVRAPLSRALSHDAAVLNAVALFVAPLD